MAKQYNTLLLPSTATSLEFDVAEVKDGMLNMAGSGTPLKKNKDNNKPNTAALIRNDAEQVYLHSVTTIWLSTILTF